MDPPLLKEEEFKFLLLLLKSDWNLCPLVSRLSPTHFRSHKAKLLGEDYLTLLEKQRAERISLIYENDCLTFSLPIEMNIVY